MERSLEFTRFQHEKDTFCRQYGHMMPKELCGQIFWWIHTYLFPNWKNAVYFHQWQEEAYQTRNTEHLHSSISPWQTTKEPPSRQHTFWRVSQVARHCFWKNSFSCLHLLPRKERIAQNNTIHRTITRIFLLPKSTSCKYSDYWEGDSACKEKLRYHIVVIIPL